MTDKIPGLSPDRLADARETLRGVTRVTPIISAPRLHGLGIKAENLQLTGSFKLRGAYYKLSRLSPEQRARGIVASSAGNHAQGLAYAAKMMDTPLLVCMPEGAPLSKIEATESYGAKVRLVPGVYDDAYSAALSLSAQLGLTLIHGFDDEDIITGQGTVGLEIIDQMPDVDTVIVPTGGGGLISGVAYAIKTLRPRCRVFGVQAAGAPGMLASRLQGAVTELDSVSTIADGIAIKRPGELCFYCCERYVDDIVTVTEDEIGAAILRLIEDNKTIAEGAGAVAVAAAMFGKLSGLGSETVCVVSGGNIDAGVLSRVITRGLSKTGRLTELSVQIADKPQRLTGLIAAIGDSGANIVSIDHDRRDKRGGLDDVLVRIVMETRNMRHAGETLDAVARAGYAPL